MSTLQFQTNACSNDLSTHNSMMKMKGSMEHEFRLNYKRYWNLRFV